MIGLEELGMTKSELQDRVIDAICDRLLEEETFDEWENSSKKRSSFRERLEEKIREQVEARLDAMCREHVDASAAAKIEEMTVQITNGFGESKSQPQTLLEYATKRCEDWMMENVDYDGKPKCAVGAYGWTARSTRLAWLIDKNLHHQVETGVKAALTDATKSIGKALAETARIQLEKAAEKLRVEVSTK